MAELHADARAGRSGQGFSFGTVTNWLGAIVSLALVVGIAVWGYKLLVRDVSGVPVVRAAEGPIRVQPDDPGGLPAAHQGLAVNAVAAEGTAEDPADRLALPPRPVDLTEEDTPATAASDSAPAPEATQSDAEAEEPRADMPVQQAAAVDDVDDLVAQLTADAAPLGAAPEAGEAPEVETSLSAPEAEAGVNRPETGLARSLRPRLRPANVAVRVASAEPASEAVALAGGVRDIDPADIPVGTRLAQLGAYDSAAVARQEWQRLEQRFGDYMDGKNRVIQRAQSGGRTFYRLRAMGFADLADARRFCAAFVAEKADCIPVVTR